MRSERRGQGATFSPLGEHFARFLEQRNKAPSPELALAATLVSRAVETGHVCVHLEEPGADLWPADADPQGGAPSVPPAEAWTKALLATSVVGRPGAFTPLILDEANRLYLQRYWAYEDAVARFVRDRARTPEPAPCAQGLRSALDRYFPSQAQDGVDWQRVAAVNAVLRPFTVISGGPGTGKTTTVVKILGLLVEQCPEAPPRIALAAPTGKAAARLKDSIRAARDGLDAPAAVREAIPAEVSTLHRLLGYVPGRVGFRHDADNPLPVDVLVVDEASMVALPLMARLTAALPPHAKLILLGDHNQLASVEAGAVLGDLCGGGAADLGTSPSWAGELRRFGLEVLTRSDPGGLADAITVLRTNYRFPADSGIGAVSTRVNRAEADAVVAALRDGAYPDLSWMEVPGREALETSLPPVVREGFAAFLGTENPEEAHRAFETFRILCVTRSGACGVEAVNRAVERVLEKAGLLRVEGRWYAGRPVMVTRNDYGLGLFNGDIGLTFPSPEAGGALRVFFPAADGGMRAFAPTRIPDHETAYAMTVHKSQGSEFERVLLLLGDHPSRALTRELVYTGMTRARAHVEIWGTEAVLRQAIRSRVERRSGLRDRLWASSAGPIALDTGARGTRGRAV